MHPTVQPSTRTTSGRHVRNGRGRHAAESVDVIAGMRIEVDARAGVGLNDRSNSLIAGVGFAVRY